MLRSIFYAMGCWLAVSGSARAQEEIPDPRPYVADVNVIAAHVTKPNLLNGEVAIIAGAACASMRAAMRDDVAAKMPAFLKDYPDVETLAKISKVEFIQYEILAFKQFMASREAAILVEGSIEGSLGIPTERPGSRVSLAISILALERRSCALRQEVSAAVSEPAPPAQTSTAKLLAKGVVGLAAIVVDAAFVSSAPYLAVAVLSIGSGGWGWNRIEEVYFEMQKDDRK
jgi:hypothetical protein